jgi:hypothetical protein
VTHPGARPPTATSIPCQLFVLHVAASPTVVPSLRSANCRSIVDYRDPPLAVRSREKSRRQVSGMNARPLRTAPRGKPLMTRASLRCSPVADDIGAGYRNHWMDLRSEHKESFVSRNILSIRVVEGRPMPQFDCSPHRTKILGRPSARRRKVRFTMNFRRLSITFIGQIAFVAAAALIRRRDRKGLGFAS